MAADDFDLDAVLSRASADTLRELEATTDLDARFARITGDTARDCRTDGEVLRELAQDPVVGDVLARIEADGKIRRYEAQQARRRTVRRLARLAGVLLVLAALLVIGWLFASALHPNL